MSCTHTLLELSPKYRPYRYLCLKCRALLKIASGIHIGTADSLELLQTLGHDKVNFPTGREE